MKPSIQTDRRMWVDISRASGGCQTSVTGSPWLLAPPVALGSMQQREVMVEPDPPPGEGP